MFQTLKIIPSKVFIIDGEVLGVLLFSIAGLLWFLVPLWDRKTKAGAKKLWLTYAGIFMIIYIVVFTIVGFITK